MAVIQRAASLVRGSLTLIALRVALLIAAALPALLSLWGELSEGIARRPYFVETRGRMPLAKLNYFLDELPGVSGVYAIALAIALFGEQILVGGALWWLAPTRRRDSSGVASLVLRTGTSWLGPMLRVTLLAAALSGLGMWAIATAFERLALRGDTAGWTGQTLVVVLPLCQAIATLLWMALVGAWAFWCRVLLVADERRRVRSVGLLVLRVFRRAPLRGPSFFAAVTIASFLGSATVLLVWRQLPPRSLPAAIAVMGLWLLTLVAQAWLWHWLLRAARLLYNEPQFNDLRPAPDAPWGVLGWLRERLDWRRPARAK